MATIPEGSALNKEVMEEMIKRLEENTLIAPSPFDGFYKRLLQPMEIKLYPAPEPDLTDFRFIHRVAGIPVYTSPHAYKTVTKVRGIASKRKPNTRRPLYRKVTTKESVAYMIQGGAGVVTSPGAVVALINSGV